MKSAPQRYIPVRFKLVLASLVALAWFGLSVFLAGHWIDQLTELVGPVAAWLIIAGVALIPVWPMHSWSLACCWIADRVTIGVTAFPR